MESSLRPFSDPTYVLYHRRQTSSCARYTSFEWNSNRFLGLGLIPLLQVLPAAALTAVEVAKGLRRRGILIRYFGSQGGALQNYIRISSSLPWHTDLVIYALSELLVPGTSVGSDEGSFRLLFLISPLQAILDVLDSYKPEAILFDMDGVLADVSTSYRQAIIQTSACSWWFLRNRNH